MSAISDSQQQNYPHGALNGEQIWEDSGPADIKYAAINLTATGDIVALVAGKKIRILGFALNASAAFTAKFSDGTNTVDITGPFNLTTSLQVIVAPTQFGVGETAAGGKLTLTLVGTGTVAGYVVYCLH